MNVFVARYGYCPEECVSTYTSLTSVSDIFPRQVTDILKKRDIPVEDVKPVALGYDILLLVCCVGLLIMCY